MNDAKSMELGNSLESGVNVRFQLNSWNDRGKSKSSHAPVTTVLFPFVE